MTRSRIPLALLTLIVSTIVGTNYIPHTWLTGWDNLHPEFNFPLHIERSLFAVWQEYQGLGLVGGMGHAADLPRQLILWVSSLVVPQDVLRYAWTFGMLLLGSVGCYTLTKRITGKIVPAFAGGLFYLLNLATIQMFYTPFEAFTTHFGFLPWLVLAVVNVLRTPSRAHILSLAALSFVSATQGYVPTVFVVWCVTLFILCLGKPLKRSIVVWAIVLCTNAFWLLPFGYFALSHSQVTVNAKINQMATEEVYLKNRRFGTLWDTVRLKGFWFDTFDFNPTKSELAPLLSVWRTWSDHPWVSVVETSLFGIVLVGAWAVLRKHREHLWTLGIFLLGITMLTTETPPFSWINTILRTTIPYFTQIFRFPFTKFSIITGFAYGVLFAIGVSYLLDTIFHKKRLMAWGFAGLIVALLIVQAVPLWQGKLFYDAVRQDIPKEYFDLFTYLNSKPLGRVANLPQPTYWGWVYERWGYSGSGFLWYGTYQPILDRAFDVWSSTNENYFWELSRALYAKDTKAVEAVFTKYDIRYILLDENVISTNNSRSLFIDETKTLLANSSTLKVSAKFGKLTVYEKTDAPHDFVSMKANLPIVNPYEWTDNDVAYEQIGDYITGDNGITYPYRSLFTKRSSNERAIVLTPTGSSVYDSTKSADLTPANVKECGLLKQGFARAELITGVLRFTSTNQRSCLSFDIPTLSHRSGYLVDVESDHISGRPLMIALINDTARHVEVETFLGYNNDSFILPPLAADGLGYTVYLSNDAIGSTTTVNDLKSIRIYTIPYNEMVSAKTSTPSASVTRTNFTASHPNPSFYKVNANDQGTLILSQSYDQGWVAFDASTKTFFPHVMIDNWKNGWTINSGTTGTIYIFFWPQLLEFLGFILLPLPFLYTRKLSKIQR